VRKEYLAREQEKMRKRQLRAASEQAEKNPKERGTEQAEKNANKLSRIPRRKPRNKPRRPLREPSDWELRSVGEIYLSPNQVAWKYNVSSSTARRWIRRIMGDEGKMGTELYKKQGKRSYRLRRVPRKLLEKWIDQFING
jgi:hypothetical protein